jgi:hypothetical protein
MDGALMMLTFIGGLNNLALNNGLFIMACKPLSTMTRIGLGSMRTRTFGQPMRAITIGLKEHL